MIVIGVKSSIGRPWFASFVLAFVHEYVCDDEGKETDLALTAFIRVHQARNVDESAFASRASAQVHSFVG